MEIKMSALAETGRSGDAEKQFVVQCGAEHGDMDLIVTFFKPNWVWFAASRTVAMTKKDARAFARKLLKECKE